MCIIAIVKSGVDMPSKEILQTCWRNNPDGSGYMFARNGKVEIRKGFMSFDNFYTSLMSLAESDRKELPFILHFRIGTSGGNTPQNTHPFPITKDVTLLQSKRKKCDVAVAHNGIISIKQKRKDISDTMEYISTRLYKYFSLPLNPLDHSFLLDVIEEEIDSKFAFLEGNGRITTIGTFNEYENVFYSNYGYETKKYTVSNAHRYRYLYDDDYDYLDAPKWTPTMSKGNNELPKDYYVMLDSGAEYEQHVDGLFTISQIGCLYRDGTFLCQSTKYAIFDTVGNIVEWYSI